MPLCTSKGGRVENVGQLTELLTGRAKLEKPLPKKGATGNLGEGSNSEPLA